MLLKKVILLALLLVACRRDAPPAAAQRSAAEVRPGSVLIIENRPAVARFLRGDQISFDDVWTPEPNALPFLDSAVLRFLDTHPREARRDPDVGIVRERLGAYVRECAGIRVAGRRQVVCQFVLMTGAIPVGIANEDRSFTNISDGGCAVFRVVADIDRREILTLGCNGVA